MDYFFFYLELACEHGFQKSASHRFYSITLNEYLGVFEDPWF